MIRVVIDTNVVVSSLLADGPSRAVLNLAYDKKFAWYASTEILTEFRTILAYPRLQIVKAQARRVMTAIRENARIVTPHLVLSQALEEEDNRFLECAQAAKANYLVTGNLRHFPNSWKFTRIEHRDKRNGDRTAGLPQVYSFTWRPTERWSK